MSLEIKPGSDPIALFSEWYSKALESSGLEFPNATTLSTVDPDGYPNGRIVLLRGYDSRGFTFYTNRTSLKGRSLNSLPRAAMTFYWDPLQRQIRIQGNVTEVSAAESDAYFAARPREHQIGAWASLQSQVLPDKSILQERVIKYRQEFENAPVPRPEHWGGFRLDPRQMEFWILGPARLHDRFVAIKQASESAWVWEGRYP